MIDSDSVFFPHLVTYGFERDRPEIPLSTITVPLNKLENNITTAQAELLEKALNRLMRQGTPFLRSGDLSGIAGLTTNLSTVLQGPIFEAWSQAFALGSEHGLSAIAAAAPTLNINFNPLNLRNSAAEQAVLNRVNYISGNFSAATLNTVKQHLINSIVPDSDGNVISRRELRDRIGSTLSVARARAETIARTESTAAYNAGRVETYKQSSMVEAVRFLAITDARATDICRSRNGMVIEVGDKGAIAQNGPPLHFRCRSVLSPLLPKYNKRHREMMDDPRRRADRMALVALPDGWRSNAIVEHIGVVPGQTGTTIYAPTRQEPPHL